MFFLKIRYADISFCERTLMCKFYTMNKVLLITGQVQIIDPKKFVIAVLNVDSKTFIVYMAIRKREEMPMHFESQAQIEAQTGAQVGAPQFGKAATKILAKYFNYSNVFLAENAAKLPQNIGMNEHIMKLEDGKQAPF